MYISCLGAGCVLSHDTATVATAGTHTTHQCTSGQKTVEASKNVMCGVYRSVPYDAMIAR